MTTKGRS